MGIVTSACDILSKHHQYLKRKAAGVGRAACCVCCSRWPSTPVPLAVLDPTTDVLHILKKLS